LKFKRYQPSTTCPEWNRRVNPQLFFRTTNNEQRTTIMPSTINHFYEQRTTINCKFI